MAIHRLRLIVVTVVAALLMAALAAAPALATGLRVEAPHRTVFQGQVKPFVGTLRGHTTTEPTALGALVTASRRTPFELGLGWSDQFGGAWNGFFVKSIAGVSPPVTAFWALKVNQKLSFTGLGSTPVRRGTHVLVYYTTFGGPPDYPTQPTLGLRASDRTVEAGSTVTLTVSSYDDAGTGTPAADSVVWVNGVGLDADAGGAVTLRLAKGSYRVRATSPGAIRSRTLWVHAS